MEIALSPCWLRPFRDGDQACIARYANKRRVWLNLRDGFPNPCTEAYADAWVLEKAGYALEGRLRKSVIKDGQTIDQLLFACVRE